MGLREKYVCRPSSSVVGKRDKKKGEVSNGMSNGVHGIKAIVRRKTLAAAAARIASRPGSW